MKKIVSFLLSVCMVFSLSLPAFAASGTQPAPMDIDGFIRYLNQTYASVETPMGTEELSFDYHENTSSFWGYDYWIQTDWKGVHPYDIQYSILYSDEQKAETIRILSDVQKLVARDVSVCLPGKKVEGGYYTGFYKYPSVKVGYGSTKFLSWNNYSDSSPYGYGSYYDTYLDAFHWTPETDDYDFTAGLTDSLDDIAAPVLQERGAVACDTTLPFTVAKGKTYQFRLTADSLPTFVAGSPCFTVSFAGHWGRDYFFQVKAVGAPGESSGFYINGAPSPVTVATVA